jgi:hypothetical protein
MIPGVLAAASDTDWRKPQGLAEVGADSITVDETSAGEEMARAVKERCAVDPDIAGVGKAPNPDEPAVSTG